MRRTNVPGRRLPLRPITRGSKLAALALTIALGVPGERAQAAFFTIDIGSVVNSTLATGGTTFPIGTSAGNQGTGITFLTSEFGNTGSIGVWNPLFANGNTGAFGSPVAGVSVTVDVSALNLSGQSSFYALLNNYFGTPGVNEYDVTVTATTGETVTYQSIGGVDTRDYNANVFTNTIAATTTPWYDNGVGQRIDVRAFDLPGAFYDLTIGSFTVTQVHQGLTASDAALFMGLSFSDVPATFAVPLPPAFLLLASALSGLIVARRRRRDAFT